MQQVLIMKLSFLGSAVEGTASEVIQLTEDFTLDEFVSVFTPAVNVLMGNALRDLVTGWKEAQE